VSDLDASWRAGLEPDPDETVSEWAPKPGHRVMPSKGTNRPGPYSHEIAPYLVEIMDHFSASSPTRKVAFMKGAQVGGTDSVAGNAIGYWIHRKPGPIMLVEPTIDMAKAIEKQKIGPLISESKVLRKLVGVGSAVSRNSSDTILYKDFPNGFLRLSGANSAASLSSVSIQYLILDEVDRYPHEIDEDGDPISLAMKRISAFSGRSKVLLISTPTLDETSRIKKEFLGGDRRYYNVPCPHRDADGNEHFIKLEFKDLIWDRTLTRGRYKTVHMCCPKCKGTIVETRHKTAMLARGVWIPENPGADYPSYHLSQMYNPFSAEAWSTIAKEWDESEGSLAKRKTFVNTVLGETWVESVIAPDWEKIYSRKGGYDRGTVPAGIYRLTMGADVGQDHVEVFCWGWGKNRRRALIDWVRFEGSYSDPKTWEGVREFMDKRYELVAHRGVFLQAQSILIDTNRWPEIVRPWIRSQLQVLRIRGVIGKDGKDPNQITWPGYSWETGPDGKKTKTGALKILFANVSALKQELYTALKLERSKEGEIMDGAVMLPNNVTEEVCRQLTSENLIKEDQKGRQRRYWVRISGRRAEALDCHNYARAAVSTLGWDRWNEKTFDRYEKEFTDAAAQHAIAVASHASANLMKKLETVLTTVAETSQDKVELVAQRPAHEGITISGPEAKKFEIPMRKAESWIDD